MPDPNAYYFHVTKNYSSVHNVSARSIYFEQTEPGGEEPKHSQVLHPRRARAIAAAMIYKLAQDVAKNLQTGVVRGGPIPYPDNKNSDMSPKQPMGETRHPFGIFNLGE